MNADLVLEILHQLQKDMTAVRDDIRETKLKVAALEQSVAALAQQQAGNSSSDLSLQQQPRGLEIGDEGC